MRTTPPSSDNITTPQLSWYPRDVDDQLLILVHEVTLFVSLSGLLLGFVVVVSSLKSLHEIAQSAGKEKKQKITNESWIVCKLKSKYAPPLTILGNGALLFCMVFNYCVLYFDVGGEAACDPLVSTGTVLYGLGLWTSYVIFEIRRISTGAENLKGIRYLIMQNVRLGTLCTPLFSFGAYFSTSGVYLADIQHCVLVADPILTLIFGPFDGMLSAGHIMIFIFAVRQKSDFQVVGTGNRIQPSAALTSTQTIHRITLLNRNVTWPQNKTADKIKAIARRNLKLALITVASTVLSMGFLSWVNIVSPPVDSPTARSYFYLRHLTQLCATSDAILNSISILVMTSSWQPRCLKHITAKFMGTRSAVGGAQQEESDVSTLGGGS